MEWVDFIFTSISLVLNMLFAWAMSNFQLGNLILLRWPVPIYVRVGYVFNSRFLEWKIQPISMIFGILNK